MLRLGCFVLEEIITDQVKYMFQPADLKQPEGTKRDLYIPARTKQLQDYKFVMLSVSFGAQKNQGRNHNHIPTTMLS